MFNSEVLADTTAIKVASHTINNEAIVMTMMMVVHPLQGVEVSLTEK
jgi:hypothetical protein